MTRNRRPASASALRPVARCHKRLRCGVSRRRASGGSCATQPSTPQDAAPKKRACAWNLVPIPGKQWLTG